MTITMTAYYRHSVKLPIHFSTGKTINSILLGLLRHGFNKFIQNICKGRRKSFQNTVFGIRSNDREAFFLDSIALVQIKHLEGSVRVSAKIKWIYSHCIYSMFNWRYRQYETNRPQGERVLLTCNCRCFDWEVNILEAGEWFRDKIRSRFQQIPKFWHLTYPE